MSKPKTVRKARMHNLTLTGAGIQRPTKAGTYLAKDGAVERVAGSATLNSDPYLQAQQSAAPDPSEPAIAEPKRGKEK